MARRGVIGHTYDVMIEEYAFLRSQGVHPEFMPARLGLTVVQFEKAMYLAKRRGDPRAQDFLMPKRARDGSWR